MKTLSDLPKGAIMDHHHYASPMISPTAHHALRTVIAGSVDILFKTEKFNMRRGSFLKIVAVGEGHLPKVQR